MSPTAQVNATTGMIKRFLASTMMLGLGLALGACTAADVADHWPHWAGGEPADVPPRPGAPGYEEFVAHGQTAATNTASKDAASPAGKDAASGASPAPSARADKTNAPATASGAAPARDQDAVQGGLY